MNKRKKQDRNCIKQVLLKENEEYFYWYYDDDYDYDDELWGFMTYWFEIKNAKGQLIGYCNREGLLICRAKSL